MAGTADGDFAIAAVRIVVNKARAGVLETARLAEKTQKPGLSVPWNIAMPLNRGKVIKTRRYSLRRKSTEANAIPTAGGSGRMGDCSAPDDESNTAKGKIPGAL